MAQRDDASTSRQGARGGAYFVAPLDPGTIQRQAALRKGAGHRRAAFAHRTQGDVDGQRYESVIRLEESWDDVIRRYGASVDADSDDVVDLVDWGIVEDRGRLRQQVEEEDRRLSTLSRPASSTGDPDDEGDRSGSEDELAIPSPSKATPDRRGDHGETPVSRRFHRLELLRADDLDDLRRFLQDERRARRAQSQVWEDVSDADSDEAEGEVDVDVEDVSCNQLSGSAPLLVDDDSDDDLDLMKLPQEEPFRPRQSSEKLPIVPRRRSLSFLARSDRLPSLPFDDMPPPSTSAPPSRADGRASPSVIASRSKPPITPPKDVFQCGLIPPIKKEESSPPSPRPVVAPIAAAPLQSSVPRVVPRRSSTTSHTTPSQTPLSSPTKRKRTTLPSHCVESAPPGGPVGDRDADVDELDLLPATPSKQRRPGTPCSPRIHRPRGRPSSNGRSPPVTPLKGLTLQADDDGDDDVDDIDFLSPSKSLKATCA